MSTFPRMKRVVLVCMLTFLSANAAPESRVPQYTEYPAHSAYRGKAADVVLSTAEEKMFRTRLRDASRETANFAGEYVLTTWGCGTSCIHGAVVSLRTGRVVFLPGTICCGEGDGERLEFRLNSRLLVAAGVINENSVHGAHFYEFTGRTFKHLTTIPVTARARWRDSSYDERRANPVQPQTTPETFQRKGERARGQREREEKAIADGQRSHGTLPSLGTGEPTENEMVQAMMAKFYARGGALAPAVGMQVSKISKVRCNHLSHNTYRCAYRVYFDFDCHVNPLVACPTLIDRL